MTVEHEKTPNLQLALQVVDDWSQARARIEVQISRRFAADSRLWQEIVEDSAALEERLTDLRRSTGCDFNVFSSLGLERYETVTHTPLLAELLSPTGSHGLGAFFLDTFLDRLGVSSEGRWKVKKSERADGFMDVYMWRTSPAPAAVIIENKIDHGDEPHQLFRYVRSKLWTKHGTDCLSQRSLFRVVYLSPDGRSPSPQSRKNPVQDDAEWPAEIPLEAIDRWSYHEHIHDWLSERLELLVH